MKGLNLLSDEKVANSLPLYVANNVRIIMFASSTPESRRTSIAVETVPPLSDEIKNKKIIDNNKL